MKISLNTGAYQTRSLIASAQRCVNLYPEPNQRNFLQGLPRPDAASELTHYPVPGLTLLGSATDVMWRGLYRASNDSVYGVCGSSVYYIDLSWTLHLLGTILTTTNPVSMADNGIDLVLVDGSTHGYVIQLNNNAFSVLTDSTNTFVGADKIDYLDTFFLFNHTATQTFYCSLSNSISFDPLYIANKTAYADRLVTLAVVRREIWLLGERTTEVWYDSGGSAFPFSAVPGAFMGHGCAAKYSVQVINDAIFWLGQDQQGNAIVFMGANYQAQPISTHAMANEFQAYATVADAVAHTYQIQGHVFYVLSFPTADRTWVYDTTSGMWHERLSMDSNGLLHRHYGNVGTFAHGIYLIGDWRNGNLYQYDLNNFTDNGNAIQRIRSFPHIQNELKRVSHTQFIVDMQTGATTDPTQAPEVDLTYSDDRGASWGMPRTQSMGQVGQTNLVLSFRRLGIARDRVYQVSWSSPVMTALNGAYLEAVSSAT